MGSLDLRRYFKGAKAYWRWGEDHSEYTEDSERSEGGGRKLGMEPQELWEALLLVDELAITSVLNSMLLWSCIGSNPAGRPRFGGHAGSAGRSLTGVMAKLLSLLGPGPKGGIAALSEVPRILFFWLEAVQPMVQAGRVHSHLRNATKQQNSVSLWQWKSPFRFEECC